MLGLIWTMLIGLVVGAIAKALMPGDEPGGLLVTMLLGIGGAFVGRFIARVMGIYAYGGLAGLLFAVGGAILLLWIYRKFIQKDALA